MITRMQMRAPTRPIDDQNRLVPLINVVFLVLIFLLMVGTIRPSDPFTLRPPVSSATDPYRAGTVQVLMSRNGAVLINGRSVPPQTSQLQAAISQSWGNQSSPRKLEVRADGQAPVLSLNRILRAASNAGANQIKLTTQRRP